MDRHDEANSHFSQFSKHLEQLMDTDIVCCLRYNFNTHCFRSGSGWNWMQNLLITRLL